MNLSGEGNSIRKAKLMTNCDCARCRTAKYDVSRRNTVDSIIWSGGLFRRYPSAVVAFGLVVAVEAISRLYPFTASEIVLFVLLVSARGYADLCAVDDLLDSERGVLGRLKRVLRRLHVVIIARGLSLAVLAVPFIPIVLGIFATTSLVSDYSPISFVAFLVVAGLGIAVGVLVAASIYIKFALIPEACFVGGEGVISSMKESWRSVSLGRVKTVILVGIFSLVLGFLISGVVGVGGGNESTSDGALRVASSAATTAFYSALFTHIYVERRFERDRPVHVPSPSDEESPSGGSTSPSP